MAKRTVKKEETLNLDTLLYDILIHLRDKNNFEYGEDKLVDGIVINEK